MPKRFEKWFDSISDGWNPITVREVRRLAKSRLVPYMTLWHFGLLTLLTYVLSLHGPTKLEDEFVVGRVISPLYATSFVLFFVEVGFLCRFFFLYNFICWDELLDNTPLPLEAKIDGHLASSCILSAFFLVQALPFMLFSLPPLYAVLIGLAIMLGIFVVVQFTTLIFLYMFLFFFRSTKMIVSKVIIVLFAVVVTVIAFATVLCSM